MIGDHTSEIASGECVGGTVKRSSTLYRTIAEVSLAGEQFNRSSFDGLLFYD
jgi:hypothetical protein